MLFCSIREKTCCKYSLNTLDISDIPLSSEYLPRTELHGCPHCADSELRPGDTDVFTQGCKGSLRQKHIESASSYHPKQALVSQTAGFLSSPSVLTPNQPAESKRELHKCLGCISETSLHLLHEYCLGSPRDAGKPESQAQPGSCARDTQPCSKQPGRVN